MAKTATSSNPGNFWKSRSRHHDASNSATVLLVRNSSNRRSLSPESKDTIFTQRITTPRGTHTQTSGLPVSMADDCIGESVLNQSKALKDNEILLLENVRFYKGDIKAFIVNEIGFSGSVEITF